MSYCTRTTSIFTCGHRITSRKTHHCDDDHPCVVTTTFVHHANTCAECHQPLARITAHEEYKQRCRDLSYERQKATRRGDGGALERIMEHERLAREDLDAELQRINAIPSDPDGEVVWPDVVWPEKFWPEICPGYKEPVLPNSMQPAERSGQKVEVPLTREALKRWTMTDGRRHDRLDHVPPELVLPVGRPPLPLPRPPVEELTPQKSRKKH